MPLFFALPYLSARRTALVAWQAGALCCGLTLLWLWGLIPIAGTIATLGWGLLVPWLAAFVGLKQAVTAGLLPFLPGDVVKSALAAAALPAGWKLLGK